MTIAGFALPRLFDNPRRREAPRAAARTTILRRQETVDLGECVATGIHSIFSPVRIYICVTLTPKAETLAAQREADRRLAAGMFEVDEMWSAAAVNARWARHAILTDENGLPLERAIDGARGMTDAGAHEAFFEFCATEAYPPQIYLSDGKTRIRVK